MTGRKLFSLLCTLLAGASAVSAANIGGRTYEGHDEGLGGNYSYTTPPPVHLHEWRGTGDDWTSGNVTVQNSGSNTVLQISSNAVVDFTATGASKRGSGELRILGVLNHEAADKLAIGGGVITIGDGGKLVLKSEGELPSHETIRTFNDRMVLYEGGTIEVDLPQTGDVCRLTTNLGSGGSGNGLRTFGGTIHVKKGTFRSMFAKSVESRDCLISINRDAAFAVTGMRDQGLDGFEVTGEGTFYIDVESYDCIVEQGGLTLNMTNGGEAVWVGGSPESRGGLITNHCNFTFRSGGALDCGIVNDTNGTFIVDSAQTLSCGTWNGDNIVAQNGGAIEVRTPGVDGWAIDLGNSSRLTVRNGGTLRCNLWDSSASTRVRGGDRDHRIDIYTGGTIEVLRGALAVRPPGDRLKINGTVPTATLEFGIHLVDPDGQGGATSRLDLINLPSSGFTGIGEEGRLMLSGDDVELVDDGADRMSNIVKVNGDLALHNGHRYLATPAGAFTVGTNAVLEYGLNAPDGIDPATTTNALLEVTGTCTITNGCTVKALDSGGLTPGSWVIVSAAALNVDPNELPIDISELEKDGWNFTARLRQEDQNLILTLTPKGTLITVY